MWLGEGDVTRIAISHSQLAELLGVEPRDFLAVDRATQRGPGISDWTIVAEGDDMQTSGTFPQLTTKGKGGKKKGGKRGC